MDLLHADGIRVDLATPTAAPPPWFAARTRRSLPVTGDGRRLGTAPGRRSARRRRTTAEPSLRTGRAAGRALRPTTRPWCMWHVFNEYWRHDRPVLLRRSRVRHFRRWLQASVRAPSTRSTRPGARRSGASATATGTRSPPRAPRRRPSTRRSAGLRAVLLRRAAGVSSGASATRSARVSPGRAGDHQLHGHAAAAGLDYWAWAPRWTSSPTTTTWSPTDRENHVEPGARAPTCTRGAGRRAAVAADGALDLAR